MWRNSIIVLQLRSSFSCAAPLNKALSRSGRVSKFAPQVIHDGTSDGLGQWNVILLNWIGSDEGQA